MNEEFFTEKQNLLFCTNEEDFPCMSAFKRFRFVRWHPLSTDVLPVGGAEAEGIEAVMNHLGFTHEYVYVFGEGLNDIGMLQFIQNSVAMGNAHDTREGSGKVYY